MNTTKYTVIGSEGQVAATDFRVNLTLARHCCRATQFSNGHRALVVAEANTQREARNWQHRSEVMLATLSGRLGRWITPNFVTVAL